MPFDASILGAHVVPTDTAATYPQNPDTLLAGINLAITSVTNTSAGQTPTVNFTLQDDKGNNIALSQAATLNFTMAGPTTDYGYTSFGSGTASTPGYVTESASKAACSSSGACTYTFTHAIPAGRHRNVHHRRGGARKCDGAGRHNRRADCSSWAPATRWSTSRWMARRWRRAARWSRSATAITATSLFRCTAACATTTEYCVLCHNPSNTDASHARQCRDRVVSDPARRRASISICWCIAFTTA